MKISDFILERHFAKYEFKVEHCISSSDCESLSLDELLGMADSQSLELWKNLKLGYGESQGHPTLREEVSKLYADIEADDVLIAAPQEGITIAMNTLLEEGDHVIVVTPAYQSLYEIANAIGCVVTKWPIEMKGGGWHLDPGFLEDNINEKTKLIVINFPHNPTGFTLSKKGMREIVDIAGKHGIRIFSDEMYWLLEYDEKDRLPAMCDMYEKGISLFGLSKTYSLPGLRMGWLATKDRDLTKKFCNFKDYTTICSSVASEALAIIALRAREKIRKQNLEIIRKNIRFAEGFFSRHEDIFSWIGPKAGSVAFPKMRGDVAVEQFAQGLLEKKNVLMISAKMFDFPGNHFRVGLGRKDFPQGMQRMEEYLDEL
jgi:aspartate/methionine/tyrosine aminotransferase